MTTNYFRVTVYHSTEDISAIMDSNGMFEKLWQFSSFLIQKGLKVLEISNADKFIDINIGKVEVNTDKFYLRSHSKGRPEIIKHEIEGRLYNAIKVSKKIYIPDRDKIVNI